MIYNGVLCNCMFSQHFQAGLRVSFEALDQPTTAACAPAAKVRYVLELGTG